MPVCPQCNSYNICRNGFLTLGNGSKTQVFKCKDCGSRFSETYIRISSPRRERQICVIQKDAKNLADITETKTVMSDVKGKIVEYCFKLKMQGYSETTIRLHYNCLKVLLDRGDDLTKPESIKEIIAKQSWSQSRRRNVINTITQFLKYLGLAWQPPICNVTRKIPFIPTEQEIDELIAGCSTQVATFLQLLKETAMRCGEAIRLEWKDIDFQRQMIILNDPEKGSNPRIFNHLSGKLLNMLNALPRINNKVFGTATSNSLKATFARSRKRLSFKLQNPRLKAIHFHTLRHWKATMEYHRTKDIMHVKEFLGHKQIENTQLYIQLDKKLFQNISTDKFITKVAHNTDEACKLIEVGFDYVTGEYFNGGKIFRKRK